MDYSPPEFDWDAIDAADAASHAQDLVCLQMEVERIIDKALLAEAIDYYEAKTLRYAAGIN